MAIIFHVPGNPVAQGRARAFTRPGMKGVRFYDPTTSKDWKKIVALHVPRGTVPFAEGIGVELRINFGMKHPKDRGPNYYHTRKPDLDNLIKAVKDALKGLCWHDDSQVCFLRATKNYVEPGKEGVDIEISLA
jgi:Holliday junction resolvase RusA-like endonuclease